MADQSPESQKELATKIVAVATPAQKEGLRVWIENLLVLRASNIRVAQKAKQAIVLTADLKIVLPIVKLILSETKRLAWDERGLKSRLGLSGVVVGLAIFQGQAAGVAALGTAIGVPLWVVFGAGATFAGVLYEEITGKKVNLKKTTYTVIDAERKDCG